MFLLAGRRQISLMLWGEKVKVDKAVKTSCFERGCFSKLIKRNRAVSGADLTKVLAVVRKLSPDPNPNSPTENTVAYFMRSFILAGSKNTLFTSRSASSEK